MPITQPLRAFFASSIGTIFEWYDFTLFAYLTPLIAKLFFPHDNAITGLMMTYGVFAIGFLVRPLGAIVFGHLGDRWGRKCALTYTILLMSIATFLIGLLPTYNEIGILAPLLLLVLRICQGLSAGGESTGASLFVLESISDKYRGLVGGIVWGVIGIGMLLGSFAASLANSSSLSWAWRVPFLVGILTGVIGYFVRTRTQEPAQFLRIKAAQITTKHPLWEGLVYHKNALGCLIGFYCLSAMITYLVFIFMPNYATTVLGLPLKQTSWVSTGAFSATIFLLPLSGYLSDRVGRMRCLFWSAAGFALLSFPLFQLVATGTLENLILAEAIFVLFAAGFQGTLPAASLELVPTQVRYSIIAVGYNVSYSIFGGTAPLIASALVRQTGNNASPGLYLTGGALIALIAILCCKNTHNRVPV